MRRRTDVYIGHMRDGSAIALATNAATTAIRGGDLASARATLRGILGDALPLPATRGARLDVDLAEAASLYAAVLAASGCGPDGLGYSTPGYEIACHDAQPGSDQRLKAAATHAYLLRATGDPAAAVRVGRDLARQLIARFGATDRRTLAAHGDLAVTLHAAGDCLTGRQILHRTGELVRSTYGPGDALGVRIQDRLADLTRECHATDGVGAESDDAVAGHTCGQPTATATISIADLFGDIFAGDGHEGDDHEAVDRPPSVAVDMAGTRSVATDRLVASPAGLLAVLGVAVPTARPTASTPAAPADVDVVVADAADPVDVAATWANRPTAGFPTVPVAAGLHPTWLVASPEPVAAPREIARTSTVGATGSAFGPPVTHSRATFGRMRRRATTIADSDRPQRTPTTSSNAKTTEGA
jgi:hypothetical protein